MIGYHLSVITLRALVTILLTMPVTDTKEKTLIRKLHQKKIELVFVTCQQKVDLVILISHS